MLASRGVCVMPGRRLGEAVGDRHLRQVHLVDHLAHQRLGTERAGHDAGAQRGEIEALELRILELGEEHRRHAVERRAALALDRLEHAAARRTTPPGTEQAPCV